MLSEKSVIKNKKLLNVSKVRNNFVSIGYIFIGKLFIGGNYHISYRPFIIIYIRKYFGEKFELYKSHLYML